MEHTPTPWEVIETFDYDFQIYPKGNVEAGHNQIAVIPATGDGDDKANAAHIVHCVNLYPELVEALKNADWMIGKLAGWNGTDLSDFEEYELVEQVLKKADGSS